MVRIWKGLLFSVTIFFLAKTAIAHSHEIQSLQFQSWFWMCLIGAIGLNLLSEWVAGVLWFWTLDYLGQSVPLNWAVTTFFKTTLAKYLPGNIWHLIGRVNASREFGAALDRVGLSVILESLFMVTGGLILALFCLKSLVSEALLLGTLSLLLLFLHPRGISLIFRFLAWVKHLRPNKEQQKAGLSDVTRYPGREILGGVLFMLLRGSGFCLTLLALQSLDWTQLPRLLSGFSWAWVLGIVLPAPGGMGVFESAAIQVLDGIGTPGLLLSSVVLFRFLCILSEAIGVAGIMAWPTLQQVNWEPHHSLKAIAIPFLNAGSRPGS